MALSHDPRSIRSSIQMKETEGDKASFKLFFFRQLHFVVHAAIAPILPGIVSRHDTASPHAAHRSGHKGEEEEKEEEEGEGEGEGEERGGGR